MNSVIMNKKGSAVVDLLLGTAIVIFIVLPVFAAVVERFVILNKVQILRDTVDITSIAAYHALYTDELAECTVMPDKNEILSVYKSLLIQNLKLNTDLSPQSDSIADGNVTIEEVEIYTQGFPLECPHKTVISRPSIHTVITVPVKPSLYRHAVLNKLGRQYIELNVHVDTDIPVNN